MTIKSKSFVAVDIWLELSEIEARALLAMTQYGHKPFLEGYYKHLGKSVMQPYAEGIESLFNTLREHLPMHLEAATKARDVLKEANEKNKLKYIK